MINLISKKFGDEVYYYSRRSECEKIISYLFNAAKRLGQSYEYNQVNKLKESKLFDEHHKNTVDVDRIFSLYGSGSLTKPASK